MVIERRKYDTEDTRDIAIETRALLQEHSDTDEDHFHEIKSSITLIADKLDKLNRNQVFIAGILATIIFLMNYPQVIRLIQPEAAHAEAVHAP